MYTTILLDEDSSDYIVPMFQVINTKFLSCNVSKTTKNYLLVVKCFKPRVTLMKITILNDTICGSV